jgi:hypothetical protein
LFFHLAPVSAEAVLHHRKIVGQDNSSEAAREGVAVSGGNRSLLWPGGEDSIVNRLCNCSLRGSRSRGVSAGHARRLNLEIAHYLRIEERMEERSKKKPARRTKELVVIARFPDEAEARMAAGKLGTEQIVAQVDEQVPWYGGEGQAQLKVSVNDAAKAIEILKETPARTRLVNDEEQ